MCVHDRKKSKQYTKNYKKPSATKRTGHISFPFSRTQTHTQRLRKYAHQKKGEKCVCNMTPGVVLCEILRFWWETCAKTLGNLKDIAVRENIVLKMTINDI